MSSQSNLSFEELSKDPTLLMCHAQPDKSLQGWEEACYNPQQDTIDLSTCEKTTIMGKTITSVGPNCTRLCDPTSVVFD
ncbi:uncharacterized protein ARMOST_10181 [Armillaria ostoyae]|uniref:Uncharacterized protein n=1 Tax=Armillaria ostoyae TaxID=47428 RepID=A0A284RDJ3_ARMOS|nr:uncharacterized protein ARMOST_10181 [Armillaria ostoyae]